MTWWWPGGDKPVKEKKSREIIDNSRSDGNEPEMSQHNTVTFYHPQETNKMAPFATFKDVDELEVLDSGDVAFLQGNKRQTWSGSFLYILEEDE